LGGGGAQLRTKPVPIAHGGGEDSGVAVVPFDEVGEGHGDGRGVAVVVVLLLDVGLGAHQDARDIWAQGVQRGQHLTLQRIEPDHQAFTLACAVVRCVVSLVVSCTGTWWLQRCHWPERTEGRRRPWCG